MSRKIAVLGATGSIGVNTLKVIAQHRDRFEVVALAAHKNTNLLLQQCQQFRPRYVAIVDQEAYQNFQAQLSQLDYQPEILCGVEALTTLATLNEIDTVMAAVVGSVGAQSTLAAARAGKRILLANKESLVMTGRLMMEAVKCHHAEIIPVDSEHNAIFQCLPSGYQCGQRAPDVKQIILTASGGPFRDQRLADLNKVTVEQACAHPNWKMGQKVSIDSATMVNKALELIEAYWLFAQPLEHYKILLHPQSVIHSLVYYQDGSMLAQLGQSDMRVPIAAALSWPERIKTDLDYLDLAAIASLQFREVDEKRFPSIALCYEVLKAGNDASIVFNAANEALVAAFIQKKISFLAITDLLQEVMQSMPMSRSETFAEILAIDQAARRYTYTLIEKYQERTLFKHKSVTE